MLLLQVGCAVIFNYFALLIGLSSFIVLDYYRVTAKLVDLICCIPESICCCLVKGSGTDELQNKKNKPKNVQTEGSIFSHLLDYFKQHSSPLTALVVDFYSPFLQNYIVKAIVIMIFSIWFGITMWGCMKVEDGLDLDDILPEGTVEHSYASANVEHFAAYSFTVVTKDINYSDREVQRALLQMSEEVGGARYVTLAGELTSNWLELMIDYYSGLQEFYITEYCLKFPADPALQVQHRTLYTDLVSVITLAHLVTDISQNSTLLGIRAASCGQAGGGPLPSLVEQEGNDIYIAPENFYPYVALWVSTQLQCKGIYSNDLLFCRH